MIAPRRSKFKGSSILTGRQVMAKPVLVALERMIRAVSVMAWVSDAGCVRSFVYG